MTPRQPPIQKTGDPWIDYRAELERAPAKDKALWRYKLASVAMQTRRYDEARRLLDEVLLDIGGIISNDEEARKARSLFGEESRKFFVGEPYERVMAYYYRGILYWMDGEADNARACFRSAQFMDSYAEGEKYTCDYVLLDYLEGLATACLGGDGSDALERARERSKFDSELELHPEHNVFVFIEYGKGPRKIAVGEYNEMLKFIPGGSKVKSALVRVGAREKDAPPYDDLTFQATTRGGRVMDYILRNKAVFKSTSDTVGNAALMSGAVLAGSRKHQEAGLGLLAFGLVSKIVSAATTPGADTRCWDDLPRYLSFVSFELSPGNKSLTVEFLNGVGRPIDGLTKTIEFNVSPGKRAVLFVSEQSPAKKEL